MDKPHATLACLILLPIELIRRISEGGLEFLIHGSREQTGCIRGNAVSCVQSARDDLLRLCPDLLIIVLYACFHGLIYQIAAVRFIEQGGIPS